MPKTRHPVVFAGAGPGDPDLITVKAMKALNRADVIIYAGSLVPESVLTWKGPHARTLSSADLNLVQIVDMMTAHYLDGKAVVRLHTGDPSLYGAIFEQMQALKKRDIPYQVIPGVTAAFAAAAAMTMEFTLPETTQTLILTRISGRTPVPDSENLESLAAHQASMAIYLSMGHVSKVSRTLVDHYGQDAWCAVTYKVSHPEEKIIYCRISDLDTMCREHGIDRHALIIVGKAVTACLENQEVLKSKLYDAGFSHGYRSAKNNLIPGRIAVWALTSNGRHLGGTLCRQVPQTRLFISSRLDRLEKNTSIASLQDSSPIARPAAVARNGQPDRQPPPPGVFDRLPDAVATQFHQYDCHVFIFSTGIAVRIIAPLLSSKLTDPAVVVLDDRGRHAVSLVSGHLGHANEYTRLIGLLLGATPVITTATDVNALPSIDLLADRQDLYIETPDVIKLLIWRFLKTKK